MYQVYALRYAYRDESYRGEHFYGHDPDCGAAMPIDYYVWLIAGDASLTLVDAGFTEQTARTRGARHHLASPGELVRRLGHDPADVGDVVLTHLHYDHTGCLPEFGSARVHVQRREYDFWWSAVSRRGAFSHLYSPDDLGYLENLRAADRLHLVEGDWTLHDGVDVYLVSGHTPGMQVVRVDTADGPVVLASDASHFYENIESDRPYGVAYRVDLMYEAFDRVNQLAGDPARVVAGHDPRVRDRFGTEPGSGGLITRIA